jgi:hypothetical protein
VCGSAEHCLPETTGVPLCSGPVGSGAAYASCSTLADCTAALFCIDTGDTFGLPCCLMWCTSDADCSGKNTCKFLSPALYVGSVQYGVCYDGLGGC